MGCGATEDDPRTPEGPELMIHGVLTKGEFSEWHRIWLANLKSKTVDDIELPLTVGDCCDASRTRVYQGVDKPNEFLIWMHDADMAKIAEQMGSEPFDKLVTQPLGLESTVKAVSYTHLRAHETPEHLVCRLLLEKKKKKK
eukprot:TRINITY_DN420_c0_g2_i1.p2 TRINITY_DN420_c0_g2~~TRINITY_DN420_c0_g2_i1.p2  ORF type:complete len:141 (-),score=54.02 TRINITY_DN420_c0_g2_i1:76-498(-)